MTYTAADLQRILANPDIQVADNGDRTTIALPRQVAQAGVHDEASLQAAVIAECDRRAITDARWGHVFHPANGEYRHVATGARLKRMGVRKGVLDLYLIYPNSTGYGGWACELKWGKTKPTPEQETEMEYLRSVGWAVECIWNEVQAVIDSLEFYLGEKQK